MDLAALSTKLASTHIRGAAAELGDSLARRSLASVATGDKTVLSIVHSDRGGVCLARQEQGNAHHIEHSCDRESHVYDDQVCIESRLSKETSSLGSLQCTTVQGNSPGTPERNKKLRLPEPLQRRSRGKSGTGVSDDGGSGASFMDSLPSERQ